MSKPHTAALAFDATAAGYDPSRRQLIPCFDDFYGTALALLGEADYGDEFHVLDLGAGTGLLSAMILNRFPLARLTMVDGAEKMLAIARERLTGDLHRVELTLADFLESALGGPYDAIVSALAIHHLTHPNKRRLFKRIHQALRPGGCFINADQACGPTEEEEQRYRTEWLRRVKANQVSEEALSAAIGRMQYDITAPLDQQIDWLAEAGFERSRCAFDGDMFVVYSGWRCAT